MARANVALSGLTLLVFAVTLQAQTPESFRVLFGVDGATTTCWGGSLKVIEAGKYSLEPWRFEDRDTIDGEIFRFCTRPAHFVDPDSSPPNGSLPVANGFIITASAVGYRSEFSFSTSHGAFGFRASEVQYGKGIYRLGGRVYVDRVPVTARLAETPEEEDYPSVATGANGDIWLAYV